MRSSKGLWPWSKRVLSPQPLVGNRSGESLLYGCGVAGAGGSAIGSVTEMSRESITR